jgi:4-diphosphocytidyl-2C-methyl-D-erythritol kinase
LLDDGENATDYWLALVNPGFPISTVEAYSWLTVSDKSNSIEGFCAQFVPGSGHAEQINDFEAPVFVRYPQLMEIRDELLRIGAFRAAL